MQIAEMQARLPCAWRHLSWHPTHGRALDPLICSLRLRLFGRASVVPLMDWKACRLSCAGPVTRESSILELKSVDAYASPHSALVALMSPKWKGPLRRGWKRDD